jgi:hypothetical protein
MTSNGELRCEYKLHGVVVEGGSGILEVKCGSSYCGARSGVVVMHYFDLSTCQLTETKRFQDPNKLFNNTKERGRSVVNRLHSPAVRPA